MNLNISSQFRTISPLFHILLIRTWIYFLTFMEVSRTPTRVYFETREGYIAFIKTCQPESVSSWTLLTAYRSLRRERRKERDQNACVIFIHCPCHHFFHCVQACHSADFNNFPNSHVCSVIHGNDILNLIPLDRGHSDRFPDICLFLKYSVDLR